MGEHICEHCELRYRDGSCPSCDLYNGAVAAQKAAAADIATARNAKAERAWLNKHGVFAFVDGVAVQLASPEEAAPFAALTTAARYAADGVYRRAKEGGRG